MVIIQKPYAHLNWAANRTVSHPNLVTPENQRWCITLNPVILNTLSLLLLSHCVQSQLNAQLPSSVFFLSDILHLFVQKYYNKGEWNFSSPFLRRNKNMLFHFDIHQMVQLPMIGDVSRRRRLFLSWGILTDCQVCWISWAGKWLESPWLLVWWSFWWLQWACSWGCSWAWGRKTHLPPQITSTRGLLWLLMLEHVQKLGGKKTFVCSEFDTNTCSASACAYGVCKLLINVFMCLKGHFEEKRFSCGCFHRCLAMCWPFKRS